MERRRRVLSSLWHHATSGDDAGDAGDWACNMDTLGPKFGPPNPPTIKKYP